MGDFELGGVCGGSGRSVWDFPVRILRGVFVLEWGELRV